MTSNAKSKKFALDIVRSDGAEGHLGWRENREEQVYIVEKWNDTMHNHVRTHHSMSLSRATRTAGYIAVRDLVFQNAEQLFMKFQANQSTVFS